NEQCVEHAQRKTNQNVLHRVNAHPPHYLDKEKHHKRERNEKYGILGCTRAFLVVIYRQQQRNSKRRFADAVNRSIKLLRIWPVEIQNFPVCVETIGVYLAILRQKSTIKTRTI